MTNTSLTNLTESEVEQYVRLTFKQYKIENFSLFWNKRCKNTLGFANPWKKRIELNPIILSNFSLFKKVLLHEIAHILQYFRMGETYKVNGRNDFHGKVFKEVCKEIGISPETHI